MKGILQARSKQVGRTGLAIFLTACTLGTRSGLAAESKAPEFGTKAPPDISLRNEVRHAINKGLGWLVASQNTNGFWSTPVHPAITALALSAFQIPHGGDDPDQARAAVDKGYAYLLSCAQADGGIYRKDLASYNTSVSLVALVLRNRPEDAPLVLKARRFIVGLQVESGNTGTTNNAFAGGIGYGKSDKRPDLSNTSFALEALAITRNYAKDHNLPDNGADLNWGAAVQFIQACQNLPTYNTAAWVSDDPRDKGGFVYSPAESKAGETNTPAGRTAFRSYGSMSYAGLLSYVYADLKPDDPRVLAVMDWLKRNYTLEENPGMGPQGLFYYYQMMAKALSVYGADTLPGAEGRSIKWREQLALKLINLQKADGSWANENGRWFEKDPNLVTAYALIVLDMIGEKL